MIITISGKNIEVSDYLEELINKKVNKLDKYFPLRIPRRMLRSAWSATATL